ncbi:M24 family metallopeptidase [Aminobacter aganoensis]|uniref:Xaa-Pro aminopeptidase n=1 Tax=Aminobacter aganoensis TaxID=83264 RepID=A0A7X0FCE7_9HYPH|nr:M24 family metallopeptidase [Aminobacter aganoensis]MBB6357095.1 Xaa-Pro aminopeptidase [Aminobacter aganoensis]
MLPAPPPPDVPLHELERRLALIRQEMASDRIDILVLTGQKNIEYFTDYRTLSWAYHARPLFALLDESGVRIIASNIETRNLESKPRHFPWFYYDGYLPEAANAVAEQIRRRRIGKFLRIGIDYGQDMFGRGSIELVNGLQTLAGESGLLSGAAALWRTRCIKSRFEANLKRMSFAIVNAAFDQAVSEARLGIAEFEFCRLVQVHIIRNGADKADPIAMTFGKGDFIYSRHPGARQLRQGDYLWTDFRSTYGGYPADRNRIARGGEPGPAEIRLYDTTRSLTLALVDSIHAGMRCSELFANYRNLWHDAGLPPSYGLVSRIGHGGGLDVTEPPSIAADSDAAIRAGMILHIEPKLEFDGAVYQFEEIVYVCEDGIEFLSTPSPAAIPVIA